MDKQTFYDNLSCKLSALGVGQEYIDRHLSQFDSYFKGKNEQEIEAEIDKLGDLDRVAARIKRMTEKIASSENEGVDSNAQATVSKVAGDKISDNSYKDSDGRFPTDDIVFDESDIQLEDDGDVKFAADPKSTDIDNHGGRLSPKTMSDAEIKERTKKFYIILACCSPLILIALLAVAAAFAFVLFAFAMVVILASAGLIAITAGGTVVSIFGLIFSISQMVSCMPIGLYELGLSVMAGAIALLIGILIYNFAARFMPFAASKLLILGKYIIKRVKELYFYVKKEYIGS